MHLLIEICILRYIEELSQGPQGPGLLRSERRDGSNAYKLRTDGVRLEMVDAFNENDVNTTCDVCLSLIRLIIIFVFVLVFLFDFLFVTIVGGGQVCARYIPYRR